MRRGWQEGSLYALRRGSLKTIASDRGAVEVYDLDADPLELHDLVADLESADGASRELIQEMFRMVEEIEGQGEQLEPGEIDPRHLDELRALGYL